MPSTTIDQPEMAACDPVSALIQSHLLKVAHDERTELKVATRMKEVHLSFGNVNAYGENYDIALVRLARALLDDLRLKTSLTQALRGSPQLQADAMRTEPAVSSFNAL